MTGFRVALLLVVALVLSGGSALAQQRVWQHVTLGGMVARARLHDPWPAPGTSLQGSLVGTTVEVRASRLGLRLAYAEGTLRQPDGASWTLVDGEAHLVYRIKPWVSLSGGPQARTYITPYGRYRRASWEAALTFDAPLVLGLVRAFADLRRGVSSRLNTGERWQTAWAGQAGVQVFLPGTPFGVRLGYRLRTGEYGSAERRESSEQVVVGITAGGR